MKRNPFEIVGWFEEEVAAYAGAKYGVACDSCTSAIFLCLKYLQVHSGITITIPKRTYLSIPQSIIHAGAKISFEDLDWSGVYKLKPLSVYDSAKRLTSNMYIPDSYMCLSFHHKKPLPIGKGGMILTDNPRAVDVIKKMRYEGRTAGLSIHDDNITSLGWNMYMTPEEAARGLTLLSNYPEHAPDQIERPPYPDLSENLTLSLYK
jgi:dTDP-4-amino-4,6-dideoxygalactose transaminase